LFEKPRLELIHSALNSFVVFEMSAEMNNKYDIGNFAKLLEKFNFQTEIQLVNDFIKGTQDSVAYIPEIN
jgi:hypothetical protein